MRLERESAVVSSPLPMAKRVTVNLDLCVGAGYCVRDLPEVFCEAPDGTSFVRDEVATLSAELEGPAAEAQTICPSGAIEIVDA